LAKSTKPTATSLSRKTREAQVIFLIPTHALPPLSYRIPEHLEPKVRSGSAVVAPLSGRLRLGIVVATGQPGGRAREDLRSVVEGLSLAPDLVELCRWVSETAAAPLPVVLRAALPPGLDASRYRLLDPAPRWPWRTGDLVRRTTLKRVLGDEGLRVAETDGRIGLAPALPERATVEWVVAEEGAAPDLSRAPRQRELFDLLGNYEDGCATSILLSETGASRNTLRGLVRRGAVRLFRRPERVPVIATRGDGSIGDPDPFPQGAEAVVGRGGAWLWRMPTGEQPSAVAAVARAVVEGGERALVLAPEIDAVKGLVRRLSRALPAGYAVAPYHSGLGRDRAAVYEAVRAGSVDVLVGTRTAILLPLTRLGAICVVDEPNEAHRAEPGYEGLPVHVRDVALERGRIEGVGVVCLSPFPSLRLYARATRKRSGIGELPARQAERWPAVRIVDLRGSGKALSPTLLDACRRGVHRGERLGVVVNRLGYATAVTCNRCGAVRSCPNCGLPLALYDRTKLLVCTRCGHREPYTSRCGECGSDRVSPTGLAADRVRREISSSLSAPVGLLTAGARELEDGPVVVGTARCILSLQWDAVILPDPDALLAGSGIGAVERAFRLVYGAAEAARGLLLVQTRLPEHYALRAAVRGDYPAFATAELPRLRASGYPPYAHLASLILEGPEDTVRGAVESRLRPDLEPGVEMSAPVLLATAGGPPAWRVLLRSADRAAVARAATLAARLAAETRGLKARVDVDPEEV
jgi:primosomal protein N' (replication factor Y) (superfamily II helicase)